MKKDSTKVNISKNNTSKEKMLKFLKDVKTKAKIDKISCTIRVANYTNENETLYSYGIRN